VLCVLLVLQGVISYRSVPRILDLIVTRARHFTDWVPHFTSVINWTLRLGLGLLKQVKPIAQPWLAIMDHSIDIGTKKALIVLRVPIETLSKKKGAIALKDCECIGMKVCETVNGESVALDLEAIFTQAGQPKAIIKDCDNTLQKGVRLWSEKQNITVPVIDDIGHVMANALKAQFEQTSTYKRFISRVNQGAKRLRQTELAFLLPPKLRTKGRFQSISKLGQWGDKILGVLAIKGQAKEGSLLAKLRTALPNFMLLKPFIKRFAKTTTVIAQVMEILKNKGLDPVSYDQCHQLLGSLPRQSKKVKERLSNWLEQHIKIQQEMPPFPLLVSSDIVESLFGKFKHVIERSPQADMNRTTLLMPALCGQRSDETIRAEPGLSP